MPVLASHHSVTAELFIIPVDEEIAEPAWLVYAPLRQAAFLANSATINWIADLQQGRFDPSAPGADELLDLLVRLEIVGAGDERQPVTSFSGSPKPTSLTLFLTTACNLRCTYCYASAGDTPTRVMPLEVARRGIDFVVANAIDQDCKTIDIAFHGGGEPTVNWKTLTEAMDYARQRALEQRLGVTAALATNGVLSDEKIDWIVNNLDGVSLSFDGLPEVHDKHRLTISGQGSSEAVVRTIRRFDAVKFNYGLRLTVTHDQIERLEASVRYICANFKPQQIQVEPAYQLGRWREAPSAETSAFIKAYRAAQRIANASGQRISFSGARLGLLTNHFCGITQDSFCLTADGNVSACYESFLEELPLAKTFFYGSYNDTKSTFDFDLPVLNNLRKQSVDNRAFCQGCFAKWTCGGDCYHKSLVVNGPGEFAGTDRCHVIRELTKDQILEKIAESGGTFWHELPRTVHDGVVGLAEKEVESL